MKRLQQRQRLWEVLLKKGKKSNGEGRGGTKGADLGQRARG